MNMNANDDDIDSNFLPLSLDPTTTTIIANTNLASPSSPNRASTKVVKRSSLTPSSFRTKIQIIQRRPFVYRLCSLSISHLELLQELKASSGYVTLAVRIRGQRLKHLLRSDPISLPKSNELLHVSLNLQFQAEYAHFLKGKPARLHVLLQKPHRKLRHQYKTLASVHVNMDEILQSSLNDTLVLESPSSTLERFVDLHHHKESHRIARIDIQVKSTPLLRSNTDEYDDEEDVDDVVVLSSDDDDDDEKDDGLGRFKERTEKFITSIKQRLLQKFRRKDEEHHVTTAADSNDNSDDDSDSVYSQTIVVKPTSLSSSLKPAMAFEAPIEEQLEKIFSMTKKNTLYMVQRNSSKCMKLLAYVDQCMNSNLKENICVVNSKQDVNYAFKTMITKYKQAMVTQFNQSSAEKICKIGIIGDDSLITYVVQAYVNLLSQKTERRGAWDKLRLYIIPCGERRNNNQIAKWIADNDQVYRGLFFSSEWTNVFSKRQWLQPEGERIEMMILRYVNATTSNEPLRIPISEVLISSSVNNDDNSSSITIPFLKSLRMIGNDDDLNTTTTPSSIGNSPNLQPVLVSDEKNLNVTSLNLEQALSPLATPHTSKKKKNTISMLQLDYWNEGNKKKSIKEKFKEILLKRSLSNNNMNIKVTTQKDYEKKTKKIDSINISKLVCSTTKHNDHFSIYIDDNMLNNVKFVSVINQLKNTRAIPIATFNENKQSL